MLVSIDEITRIQLILVWVTLLIGTPSLLVTTQGHLGYAAKFCLQEPETQFTEIFKTNIGKG